VADEEIQDSGGQAAEREERVQAAAPEDLPPADKTPREANPQGYKFLDDVMLRLTVDIGRTEMTVRDVLALEPGSVVEFDKLAGEMMDVYVQDNYLGRGEVMVIADSLGVRLTEVGAAPQGENEETDGQNQ